MVQKEETSATERKWTPEVQALQDFYDLMVEKGLDAIEVKDEDFRIKLTRRFMPSAGAPVAPAGPIPVIEKEIPTETPAAGEAPSISAPLAGVFYRASSPASAPFVKEDDTVEPGQTLCIIEAMKVMNEIKADSRCRVTKILVENGRPVSAGQALFSFEPS